MGIKNVSVLWQGTLRESAVSRILCPDTPIGVREIARKHARSRVCLMDVFFMSVNNPRKGSG
jgi:hypothetical protein